MLHVSFGSLGNISLSFLLHHRADYFYFYFLIYSLENLSQSTWAVVQSYNILFWKTPLKDFLSNCPALNRDTYSWIRLLRALSSLTLNVTRNGAATTSLGNLCQCFTYPNHKKNFSYIQPNSHLFWFETISSCPITTDPAKESVPFFLTSSLLILKDCSQISLESSHLQAEQPQFAQPVLMLVLFYPLDHFCVPRLGMLQQVHVSPVLRTPHLSTVLQERSQHCTITSLDLLIILLLMHSMTKLAYEGTLLAHVQLVIHQYPGPFRQSWVPSLHLQLVLTVWVAKTQVQVLALVFDEPHVILLGPLLKPV